MSDTDTILDKIRNTPEGETCYLTRSELVFLEGVFARSCALGPYDDWGELVRSGTCRVFDRQIAMSITIDPSAEKRRGK